MAEQTTYVNVSKIRSTPIRRLAIVAVFLPMLMANVLLALFAVAFWSGRNQVDLIRTAREQWQRKETN